MIRRFRNRLARISQQPGRPFIIPTRYGLFIPVIVITHLLAVTLAGSAGDIVFLMFIVTASLMAMFMTHSNIENLEVTLSGPLHIMEKKDVSFLITVTNHQDSACLGVSLIADIEGAGVPAVVIPVIPGKSRLEVPCSFRAEATGVLPVKGVRVSGTWPLGIFFAWKWHRQSVNIYVFPRPEGGQPLPGSRCAPGSHQSALSGQSISDFSGLRAFREGDRIRHIYWKLVAKGGPPLVREFQGAGQWNYQLRYCETSHRSVPLRLRQLSAWIHALHEGGHSYSLELPGSKVDVARGEMHFYHCLRELAAVESL